MIAFIRGKIIEKFENKIILENNGIGYEVFVSNNTLSAIPHINEEVQIYTFMQVKEDGITLFGFYALEEKDLFNLLLTVSGVGAKSAINILSGMKVLDIIVAIASENVSALSSIKGLGKKTAERIIVELKNKVSPIGIEKTSQDYIETNENAINQAYQVFISLGLTKNESMSLARDNSIGKQTAEEIVQEALKNMGR